MSFWHYLEAWVPHLRDACHFWLMLSDTSLYVPWIQDVILDPRGRPFWHRQGCQVWPVRKYELLTLFWGIGAPSKRCMAVLCHTEWYQSICPLNIGCNLLPQEAAILTPVGCQVGPVMKYEILTLYKGSGVGMLSNLYDRKEIFPQLGWSGNILIDDDNGPFIIWHDVMRLLSIPV